MRTLFQFSGIILIAIAVTASSYVATDEPQNPSNMQQATFGAGCFWCVEAIFERLEGVYNVESGYSGGHADNPGYQQVTSGRTGHAEVIRFDFDPDINFSYEQLLKVFCRTPMTLLPSIRQGGRMLGTQYRFCPISTIDEVAWKTTALAFPGANSRCLRDCGRDPHR